MSGLARLFGSEGLDRKSMDIAPHTLAESFVDELMPGERALADKFPRHDTRGEVCVVVGFDPNLRLGEGSANQLCDLFWIHVGEY
jgi:hypothetical protein